MDNWQNLNWVLLSKGDLRVDSSSFAMIFSPAKGNGNLAPKPFGCLTGATIVAASEPGALSTFVATTNDPVHGLIRLDFQSLIDEEAFVALAEGAEASSCGRYPGAANSRRSSMGMSRRSSMCGPGRPGDCALSEAFRAQICERHPGQVPLVYGGVELYGPDPHGDQGSEVLLSRGAVAMLDSQDTGRVGSYELVFYDEGLAAPLLRLPIGPRMRLDRQREDFDPRASFGGRASLASRRSSMGLGGRPASAAFNLLVPGGGPWGLVFDTDQDAAGFERDLTVRQRLVTVSLKTSRGWRTVEELQDELLEVRRNGFCATLMWAFRWFLMSVVFSLFVYAAANCASEPEKPPLEVALTSVADAVSAFVASLEWLSSMGTATCALLGRCVPASELERCASLPEAVELQSCIRALAGSGSMQWTSAFL